MKTIFVLFNYTLFLVLAFIKCLPDRDTGIPSCIRDSKIENLCEEDEEYDHEIRAMFDKAIENAQMSSSGLKMLIDLTTDPNQSTGLQNAESGSLHDFCPFTTTTIYPKRGMDVDGDWVFILNHNTTTQAIRIQTCLNTDNARTQDNACTRVGIPGVITYCKQKYIYKNVLSIDKTGREFVSRAVEMPSCCGCAVETIFG